MDFLSSVGMKTGAWLLSHLSTVSLMVVATLLVVYGSAINGMVRVLVAPFHLLVRIAAFVLLCTFGYGLITVFLVPWVAKAIALVPTLYLFPVVLGVFVALGVAAERKRV